MKLVIMLLPCYISCCIFIYRTCLVILCIVNIYRTPIILETMDWGNRRRRQNGGVMYLTKTLTLIYDGAGRRQLRHSHPIDDNQLCYLLQLIWDGAGRRYLRHSHPVDANQLCYFWTLIRGGATVARSILSNYCLDYYVNVICCLAHDGGRN